MTKNIKIESLMELGQLLKSRRKELGITQKQLAKFTNLSNTGISRIELAQNDVQFETLLKLTGFLGLKINIEIED